MSLTHPALRTLSVSLVVFCFVLGSTCFAQVVDLTVDASQSSLEMTLAGDTEVTALSGTGQIDLQPASQPFGTAQVTDLEVVFDDGFSFSFLGGFVQANMSPGDGTIELVTAGPAGTVNGANQFDQLGNESQSTGTVNVIDPFNLAGGTRTIDLSSLGTSIFDMLGVQLTVAGDQLTVSATLDLEIELDGGLTLAIVGDIVSTGTLPALPVDVAPDSSTINQGLASSGSVGDLAVSDNVDYSVRRNPSGLSAVADTDFKGISPNGAPGSLTVTFESSVFARSAVSQTISLFNYETNSFEAIDTRNAARFSDLTVVVPVGGDVSRFIESGTQCMTAKVRYVSPVARQQFSANMDQFIWTIE